MNMFPEQVLVAGGSNMSISKFKFFPTRGILFFSPRLIKLHNFPNVNEHTLSAASLNYAAPLRRVSLIKKKLETDLSLQQEIIILIKLCLCILHFH